MMWRRYRFHTHAVDDCRPLIFNPRYPWWISATADQSIVIVAYLPADEPLAKYWNDAFDVEYTEQDKIVFSDRFPKPDYYRDEGNSRMNDTNQLTTEQVQAIEQSIASLKELKIDLQRIVTQAQEKMTEIGKIEYKLINLLPIDIRIDHLIG